MRIRHVVLLAAIPLFLSACATSRPVEPTGFSFGLWGDMPYKKAGDELKLPAVLKSINASDIAFSIYDGDIKDGSSHCTDDVYVNALKMFNSMVKPVVYVPGDNEWTDCHRLNNGGYDGLERLAHIRRTMFAAPGSLGQSRIALEHQARPGEKFVENTRFSRSGVVFAGIHMPGSNNNKVLNDKECQAKSARTLAQCAASNSEYLERDAANVVWLSNTFEKARADNAVGVVVVVQGDPGFDLPETEDIDESTAPSVSGYRNFMSALVRETEKFKGQVLFVHGDTHYFKVDKPLYSPYKLLPNLTRLQTFGSPSLHWVRVKVDPTTVNVFEIQPVMVQQQ